MGQPTPQDMHVDAVLSDMSLLYKNKTYIADEVFEILKVIKQSDKYYTYPKGAWFRDEAGVRGPGTRSKRGGYALTTDDYFCNEYSFAKEIPDEDRANADAVLDPDQDAVEFATDIVLRKKERLISTLVTTAGNWTSSEDADGKWVASSGNTFIEDVNKGIRTILGLTGIRANRLVLDYKTFLGLAEISGILDRIHSGTTSDPATVKPDTIAALFGLDKVLVGDAVYSDAEEVLAGTDFNAVDMWEANAGKGMGFLYYAPPRPAKKTPAAGYIFNWLAEELTGLDIEKERIYRGVRQWREEAEHQDVVEAFEKIDPKVISADLGYLFYDTYAT